MEGTLDMFMFTLPMVGLPQRGSTDLCCVALICKLTLMCCPGGNFISAERNLATKQAAS